MSTKVLLATQNLAMYLVRDGLFSSDSNLARRYDANDLNRIESIVRAVKRSTGIDLAVIAA